jgi:uncharacterized membrane protein
VTGARDDGALRSAARTIDRAPLAASVLRGEWLGHPLHPMLTDLPIGFWTSAWVLDFLPGHRDAARTLVGLGVLSAVPTALAGAADVPTIDRRKDATATRHAVANATATALYALSWWQRRRGHHLRGVVIGQFAAAAATVGGYLGGSLVFGAAEDERDDEA